MDTLFFLAAKMAGVALRPDTWLVAAIAFVVLTLLTGRDRLALRIAGTTLLITVTLGILPLGDLMLQPIERSYPTQPSLDAVDGILVLGGAEIARASAYWGQMQLNEGGERYSEALLLARRFPDARLLFTGGSGALRDFGGPRISEADMAGRFFLKQGIATERLLLEGESRNTAENATLSLAKANPAEGETWVLVTSASHMPRAMRTFAAAGWQGLIAWPVDYRTAKFSDGIGWDLLLNLQVLNIAIRESVGQLAYTLSGR